jgi:4-amino-4-deoxy-L-arabinose transferase-like glycosyltransferase
MPQNRFHTTIIDAREPVSPWRLPARQAIFYALALATAALSLYMRLVQLDTLQAEIYNDIVIVWDYVTDILQGEWPWRFVLSAGPLYHYLIAPYIKLVGLSYYTLKLASVLVSLGALAVTYALGRRLIDDDFALLTTFIAGVSSWLLIFSRLGNSQILVPVLSIGALWLLVRFIQRQRPTDLVACAIVSALGLYLYPQTFILPGVIAATMICLRWAGQPISWRQIGVFVLLTLLLSLPFAVIVYQNPGNFLGGYIGDKLKKYDGDAVMVLLGNIGRGLLALHVRGDVVFRSNPPERPHLDLVSGLLFLGGVAFWLRPERRRWSPLLLVPLLLLQLPSMLVLAVPREVPSASRTIAIAPLAYLLAASGLWWLGHALFAHGWRRVGLAIGALLLGAILALNSQRYFRDYLAGLPYYNTPIGRDIATYVNLLPSDTEVYLVGCCWQEAMPAVQSVRYAMLRPQRLHYIDAKTLSCESLRSLSPPAVLVWSFQETLPSPALKACQQWLPTQRYSSARGLPTFNAAPLRPN